jgi:hypothetical protein
MKTQGDCSDIPLAKKLSVVNNSTDRREVALLGVPLKDLIAWRKTAKK